jgi:hypothetical protein
MSELLILTIPIETTRPLFMHHIFVFIRFSHFKKPFTLGKRM